MALYIPPFARANGARPATPESSSSSSLSSFSSSPSSSCSTSSSSWQSPCQRRDSGCSDLLSLNSSPAWRRGSGVLPTPSPSSSSSWTSPPPPRTHRALTRDWRRGAAPKSVDPDCIPGWVVLLPNSEQVPAASVARKDAQGNPWNHPAVVTKVWEADGTKFVKVWTCTTFGGAGIAQKQQHHRHLFVEATGNRLTCGSDEFSKRTWINCSPKSELTIEAKHLRIYSGRHRRGIQFNVDALREFGRNEYVPPYDSFY